MSLNKRLIKSNEASLGSPGPDISSYTYNASLSDTTGVPTGPYHHGYFFIGDSGTKLYIATTNYDSHYDDRYPLSTPYAPSSRGGRDQSVYRNPPNHYNTSLFFKPDGSKYYMTGYTNGYGSGTNTIIQATMSTPWDLNTATFYYTDRPGGFIGHNANSITFSEDGGTWYNLSNVSASNSSVDFTILRQISLSTPWDFSSTHTIVNTVDLKTIVPEWISGNYYSGGTGWTDGNFFVHAGGVNAYMTMQYYSGSTYQSSKSYRFTMSTPYDITTLSADSSFSIPGSVFNNVGAVNHGNSMIMDDGKVIIAAKGGNYKFLVFD